MRIQRQIGCLVVIFLAALVLGCSGGGQDVTKAAQPSNPKIETFKATNITDATVHLGDKPKFMASFAAGKATISDNGSDLGVVITSGVEFSTPAITKLGPHNYVLTVTGTAGTSAPAKAVTSEIAVTAVSSVSPIEPADGYQTVKTTKEYKATSSLSDPTITWSTEGGSGTWNENKWTAPNWTSAYTIRATAKDGTFSSTLVHVINPAHGSISVSTTKPLFGASVDIIPTINGVVNGSATLGFTQGGTEITAQAVSGTTYSTGPLKAGMEIWLRATNAAGDFCDVHTPVVPQTVTVDPIKASAQYVVVGDIVTFTSAVSHAQDTSLTWVAMPVGSTSGSSGSWVGSVWTAPTVSGDYTITATANADGITSQSILVHVVDNPSIESFDATMNPVPYGDHASLTAVFAAGDGTVDQGVGPVKSGVPFDSGPITTAKTFTLTVKSPGGRSVTKSLDMTSTPVTISPVTPDAVTATPGAAIHYSATAANAADNSVVWSASGGSITTDGIWQAPSVPGSYKITATSRANSAVSSSTTVTVVLDPTITDFSASSDTVLYGDSVQVTPTFPAGTGSVDQGVGLVTSGATFTTRAITADTTFTLTVMDTINATNLIANPGGESGLVGHAIGADAGVVQDPAHAHAGSWTRAFALAANTGQPIQNAMPAKPGQVFMFDGWYLGSTDLASPASIQFVWVDASGNKVSADSVTITPKAGAWQEAVLTAKAPTGAAGMIPSLVGSAVPAEVGQFIYLDDLLVRRVVQASVTVKPSAVVIKDLTPSNAILTVGKTLAFTAVASGAVDTAIQWSVTGPGGGGTWNGTVWTAPMIPGDYTVTAASAVDSAVSASALVKVVLAPKALSLVPEAPLVAQGAATNITPTFANGIGQVDHGIGAVQSGVPFSSGPLSAVTKFTLTVTNEAGDSDTATVNILVKTGSMTPLVPSTKTQSITKGFQILGGEVSGLSDPSVIWSVNGVDGGSSVFGTVSPTGYYTAPATMPGGGLNTSVTIRCRSTADSTLYQEMTVSLWNMPVIVSFTVN